MIGLAKSRVSTAHQDQRDVGLCGAESFGYFGLGHRSSQAPDFDNLLGSEEFFEPRNQAHVYGVQFVEHVVCPFEIGVDRISFDAIDVIHHGEVVWIRDEGHGYETMDIDCFRQSLTTQDYLRISGFVDSRLEDLSVASLRSVESHSHAIHTADAAKITDFVEFAEPNDRNRSPVFGDAGMHDAGGPSGFVGSTIKSPSHAATFGGFAIMASVSDSHNRGL